MAVINEVELEEQLKEAGNRLLNPPSTIDELLNQLDKVDHLLINVEQAPTRSMQDALLPSMKALISGALLRHSDTEVKVAVTSCISEITRITAPDAPYNDEQMKEIFQLIVASFEKLSHVSGCCYMKAVSILDTVAKVRSCLVMLDLEMDELIVEMFQQFLKIIRSNHPHTVFQSMETIMTLVIDESEDIALDLLTLLLSSVRKENQSVSPIAWKLGEKVMTNCAAKLKPYVREAVQSLGIALDECAPIVASISANESPTLKAICANNSREHLVTMGLSPDAACPGEVFQAVDEIPKSAARDGSASPLHQKTGTNDNSLNILEHYSLIQCSRRADTQGNAEPAVKLEIEPETIARKRGRRPNSLMNPEEGYDHSWIHSGRKTVILSNGKSPHAKGIEDSLSENPFPKRSLRHFNVVEPMGFTPKTGEALGASSLSPKQGLSSGTYPKRGRPKKGSIMSQDADPSSLSVSKEQTLTGQVDKKVPQYKDVSLREQPEDRSNSEAKQRKRSRKSGLALMTTKETSLARGYVESEKKSEKEKQQHQSTKVGVKGIDKDSLWVQNDIKKRSSLKGVSDEIAAEASVDKKTISLNRDGGYQEDTPSAKLKGKHTPRREVVSETPNLGEQLIGSKIKVWWPLDKTFYEGVVDSYDPIKKKHRVLYADGDEETLNLKRQRWELIGDYILPNEGQETDIPNPNGSSDVLWKEKGKPRSGSSKQSKADAFSKRFGDATVSKAKSRASGSKSVDGALHDVPIVVDRPMGESSKPYNCSKDDGKISAGKLKIKGPRAGINTRQMLPQTVTPSNDQSPKGDNKFCGINSKQATPEAVTPSDDESPKGGNEFLVVGRKGNAFNNLLEASNRAK